MNTDLKNQHDPAGLCPPVSRTFEVAEYVGRGLPVPEALAEVHAHSGECAYCGDIVEGAKWEVRREVCQEYELQSPLSPTDAVEGAIVMSLPPRPDKAPHPQTFAPALFRISIDNSETPLGTSGGEILATLENVIDSPSEQNTDRFVRLDGDTLVYIVQHEQEAAANVVFVVSSGAAYDRRQKRIPPGRNDHFYQMNLDRAFAVSTAWTSSGSENEDTVIEIRMPSVSAENGNAECVVVTRVIRFSPQVWKQTGIRKVTISRQ